MPTPIQPRIFALLVGIDTYPSPIPSLNGCVKDVDRITNYLEGLAQTQQVDLQLQSIKNEQATYRAIVQGFRQHLTKAGPKDVVWFHFSGHGMEDFTAKEFKTTIEPNGKDQNLVCYQTEGEPGPYLLADKELGVLLHEVATANTSGGAPHMVVSLDCCHAGSGTRFEEWEPTGIQPRTITRRSIKSYQEALQSGKTRSLESYLDGYFQGGDLSIPLAEHILLSACTSIQTAGDTKNGGIFTAGLVDALESSTGPMNYADLFARTRAYVQRKRLEQLPQFETIGGFDPYRQFLSGAPLGQPELYELVEENDQWLIRCGAIHGLPVKTKQAIEIEVIGVDPPYNKATVIAVGAQKSKLQLAEGVSLSANAFYQARITYLPQPPMEVLLSGDPTAIEGITKSWNNTNGLRWLTAEKAQSKQVDLEVQADDLAYRAQCLRSGRELFALQRQAEMEQLVVNNLAKIMRWERTLALANPKSEIIDRLELEMEILLAQNRKQTLQGDHLALNTRDLPFIQHQGNQLLGFLPKVKIKDTSQQLHCYLFHLRSDYSIQSYEGEYVFRPFEHPGQNEISIPLLKTHKGWGLGPKDQEAISYFKLFVTTEELDYQQLLQSGLGGERDAAWAWAPVGVSDDWCSLMMKVQLQQA